ncbi:9-O-acetylesterase [Paenibacillus baekrokdamisoli]|uniref:9-O-acetylesterase n=1 Tax=Paenibacillus baekrokdamisoli TaxID=1712516 RepID=A0A3G9JB16_9BACL|nr:sialate O-acetylesterase [Paenibacillus baekrokdamisoli]MBB3070958.1 sialate O-acetylesterase [Paenibacillus baekrokdamisoli]BBH22103.1 9-O-acetylesterase [Paenibacillus baekrokdamisoli]
MNAEVRVNAVFSDHMVLQREATIPVWGTGLDGMVVKLQFHGKQTEAVVANGCWRADLPAEKAGGPYELIIEAGNQLIVFRDVLIGDVWLAGGQSNMQWSLAQTDHAQAEIVDSHIPDFRFYDVPRVSYEDGIVHSPSWKVCTPEHAGAFSAVAYYFAKGIITELGIPIGIIGCNWGGTSIACWVSEQVLTHDDDLRIYADEYNEQIENFDWDVFAAKEAHYKEQIAEYDRRFAAGLREKELGDFPAAPMNPHYFLRPFGLYSTMLLTVVPFALKGVLFYQGESDAHRPLIYDKLLTAMISHWRTIWHHSMLPFLFVQLPAFGNGGNANGKEWPLLRESQLIVTEQVPYTGMVVALDCGDLEDIHPTNKKPVGERLALLALERVYEQPVESSGPVYKDYLIDHNKIILHFDHTGNGLEARGNQLIGFEIADETNEYVSAQAVIEGATVEVWSDQIVNPLAVRYGWANYTEANLVNSFGLPAGPFRTKREERQ